MVIIKSLKVHTDKVGHGYYHRVHRKKKKKFKAVKLMRFKKKLLEDKYKIDATLIGRKAKVRNEENQES